MPWMPTAEPTPTASDERVRVVYLVRHAQSEQNIATARLQRGDVAALADIARLGYDAPVSGEGRQQLEDARKQLDGFATSSGIELVAHSPYIRAVETAKAVFAGFTRPLVTLPPLHERTISEYFFPWLLDARIRQVRDWLEARPETVIALVGHGQFFKRCIDAPGVQPNVSIIRTKFSRSNGFVPDTESESLSFGGFAEPSLPPS